MLILIPCCFGIGM